MPSVRIVSAVHGVHGEHDGLTSVTWRRCLASLRRALPLHQCHGARANVAPDQLGLGDGRYSQCLHRSPGGAAISHACHTGRRMLRFQLLWHMHPHAPSFQAVMLRCGIRLWGRHSRLPHENTYDSHASAFDHSTFVTIYYNVIFTQEYPISAQHCSPWVNE